jgi:hypothetical protein
MDQNLWIALLTGVAITAGLFALGVVLYPKLKVAQPNSAFEAAVEAALLPIIYQGICAAYRLNEISLNQLHQAIAGANKKEIADSIYAMLPDRIGDYDLSLVKRIVSQERFEKLVQAAFDRFDRFYVEHQAHFDELFKKWQEANAPAGLAPAASVSG